MKLTIENPWWNAGGLWQDPDLIRVKRSCLRYHPRPFSVQECMSPSVYTLRGPRRAGKTVALKLLIAELIEKSGWNPQQILWTTFDSFRTLAQIEEHLLNAAEKYRPRLLLVDEVTAVTGWQRVVKKLRDNGILGQTCVILTGSSAHDLKAGAERMAGRRGDAIHPDRVLLPLSFSDFVTQLNHNGILKSPHLVQDYLKVGGFPFRVEKFILAQKESKPWEVMTDFQVFDDVIFYEFNRRKLDRSIAIEVLGRLGSIQCSATSYEGFAKALSIARDTARKYLDALGDSFLLATISSYDTSRGRVAPKKDKKLIWMDPAFGYVNPWFRQGPEASEATRAEFSVGAELLRNFEVRIWEGVSAPRSIFTWKSSSGKEVDFLIVDKSQKLLFPVEVKFQNSISDWDFQVIEKAFKKGWIVTPEVNRKRPLAEALSLENFLVSIDKTLSQLRVHS